MWFKITILRRYSRYPRPVGGPLRRFCLPSGERPTFVSLFCGCGGFDLGFIQAGFRCIGAYDIDPIAIETHRRNLKSPARVCDLVIDSTLGGELTRADVVFAGPPCQGFSVAGKRDLNDPRNELLPLAGQIAIRANAPIFIAENVLGAQSGQHAKYWSQLRHCLEVAGYFVAEFKCLATNLGVPQMRKRWVLLAWRKVQCTPELVERPGGTLRSALANVTAVADHSPLLLPRGSSMAMIAARIRPGQKLSNVRKGPRALHTWDIPSVFGPTTAEERKMLEAFITLRRRNRRRDDGDADPVSLATLRKAFGQTADAHLSALLLKGYVRKKNQFYDLTNTFNGKFRRLAWDEPSLTVDTRFGDPRYFLHPDDNRGFTVRETSRLQGFPDTYLWHGSKKDAYRMLGNAVPPPMAKAIAELVKSAILANF